MYSHSRTSGLGTGLLAFIGGMVVWAMFGQKIKQRLNESTAWRELKLEVDQEVSKVKDITQNRYNQIVDQVSDRYGRLKNISNHELKDLTDDLKKHWNRIQTAWRSGGQNPPSGPNIDNSVV
jgi:hypothetical protein